MELNDKANQLNFPESKCLKVRLTSKASRVLLDLITVNKGESRSIFEVKKSSKVGIEDYLDRIISYSEMEDSTLIVGIILVDRIMKEASLKLSHNNIHRILIACLVVALKLNEDIIFTDKEYAMIGGINLKLFIELEKEALQLLDWRVEVTYEEYMLYKTLIEGY